MSFSKIEFRFSLPFASSALASLSLALFAFLASLAAPPALAPAYADAPRNYLKISDNQADKTREIRLGLNKSIVIDLPRDAHDILVANPEVADAVTRTSRRVYLFGKKIGQTNIFVFDGAGRQMVSLELLIERDIAGLEGTIKRFLPNSDVRAEMINDNMVLTGTVSTPQEAAMAVRLAQVFVRGGEQTEDRQSANAAAGSFVVLGDTDEEERMSDIVNLLKIEGEDQVHLKVIVAEIQRSVVKQLGFNTRLINEASDGFGFSVRGNGIAGLTQLVNGSAATIGFANSANSLVASYNALEQNGVMRTLAEPSLSAVSGEKAHFRAGGTYHLPSTADAFTDDDGDRVYSLRFTEIDYGISLTFTPVVLSQGRISLKIRAEVSEPTAQGAPTINPEINLLSLRKRLADTTVELPSGGSMMIAGLVQDDIRQLASGHPGLKDIPFFGSLFRSREFVRNESEVIVIVTPYLVRPAPRSKLALPDQGFAPAADGVSYFLGRLNRVYGAKTQTPPKGRYAGTVGFILE